jgi:hypothetical protein
LPNGAGYTAKSCTCLRRRHLDPGETSRERMRARTQLPTAISNRRKAIGEGADQATVKSLNAAVEEASRNARAAGYTPAGIARIISTPSDVSMFSKLPEADQQAILRQANKEEFERYIGHAHMKLRKPIRDERNGRAKLAAYRGQHLGPVPWGTSFRILPQAHLKLPKHAILRRVAGYPCARHFRSLGPGALRHCVGVLLAYCALGECPDVPPTGRPAPSCSWSNGADGDGTDGPAGADQVATPPGRSCVPFVSRWGFDGSLLINPSVRARPGTGRRDAAIESAALHAMMRQQSGGGGISVRAAPCLKALPTRDRPPLPRVASAQKGVAPWKCSPPRDPLGPAPTMQIASSRWTRSQNSSAL